MRAVVQRALSASVTINGGETRSIGRGLAVFLGVVKGDAEREANVLAGKLSGLRVFSDEADKMNLSLSDAGGQVLLIPNFTLGTDCKKGRRPSFDLAAPPDGPGSCSCTSRTGLENWGSRWSPGSLARICGCRWKMTAL